MVTSPRSINDTGLNIIKKRESCRLIPYQDQKGIWSVGYGHTKGITSTTKPWTQQQADAALKQDVQDACDAITHNIRVKLTDNQFSALASLVYNTGPGVLYQTLGDLIDAQRWQAAADEFLKWDHVRIKGVLVESNGLLERRKEERALFLTPDNTTA